VNEAKRHRERECKRTSKKERQIDFAIRDKRAMERSTLRLVRFNTLLAFYRWLEWLEAFPNFRYNRAFHMLTLKSEENPVCVFAQSGKIYFCCSNGVKGYEKLERERERERGEGDYQRWQKRRGPRGHSRGITPVSFYRPSLPGPDHRTLS